eukprot:Clim_evm25s157 gene=Clim_evmTU25s157
MPGRYADEDSDFDDFEDEQLKQALALSMKESNTGGRRRARTAVKYVEVSESDEPAQDKEEDFAQQKKKKGKRGRSTKDTGSAQKKGKKSEGASAPESGPISKTLANDKKEMAPKVFRADDKDDVFFADSSITTLRTFNLPEKPIASCQVILTKLRNIQQGISANLNTPSKKDKKTSRASSRRATPAKKNAQVETPAADQQQQAANLDTLDLDLDDLDLDLIAAKLEQQQKKYEEFEKKEKADKLTRVQEHFPWMRAIDAQNALEEVKDDIDELVSQIVSHGPEAYLLGLRKRRASAAIASISADVIDRALTQRRSHNAVPSKTANGALRAAYREHQRLALDDALAMLEKNQGKVADDDLFAGWSEARIRAWKMRDSNPNSYYYRFNDPGVKQATGGWKPDEKKIFLERLAELGADGRWGIFSMTIPGRVGYQCSNFYRSLIKKGEIKDENYTKDEKGNPVYMFTTKDGGKQIRKHTKWSYVKDENRDPNKMGAQSIMIKEGDVVRATATYNSGKKRKRGSKSATGVASDEDDDEYDDRPDKKFEKRSSGLEKRIAELKKVNPLPGFIDPISMEEVVQPTISPNGIVLDYDTWMRILMKSKTCPLTKEKIHKRQLVKLTLDNIDAYRSLIKNDAYGQAAGDAAEAMKVDGDAVMA